MDLIEKDLDFEELEEFEGAFERDELWRYKMFVKFV
jgi:hypothetical protein